MISMTEQAFRFSMPRYYEQCTTHVGNVDKLKYRVICQTIVTFVSEHHIVD